MAVPQRFFRRRQTLVQPGADDVFDTHQLGILDVAIVNDALDQLFIDDGAIVVRFHLAAQIAVIKMKTVKIGIQCRDGWPRLQCVGTRIEHARGDPGRRAGCLHVRCRIPGAASGQAHAQPRAQHGRQRFHVEKAPLAMSPGSGFVVILVALTSRFHVLLMRAAARAGTGTRLFAAAPALVRLLRARLLVAVILVALAARLDMLLVRAALGAARRLAAAGLLVRLLAARLARLLFVRLAAGFVIAVRSHGRVPYGWFAWLHDHPVQHRLHR